MNEQQSSLDDIEMDVLPLADDILDGTQRVDLSHAGGEFVELLRNDVKKSM